MDAYEFHVNESAFWHTNMDLYYGFQAGEIVEVGHESNKYWLATIEFSYRHLVLLKWIGGYGEFWLDASLQNSTASSSISQNDLIFPKRIYPLGYHLQSQLKSQSILERPTKILVKPSLYNPALDPYGNIRTVDDLLAHEVEDKTDTFINETKSIKNETASLVIANCTTKISYGQEYVDELEAALQNLTEDNEPEKCDESPELFKPSVDHNNLVFNQQDSEPLKDVLKSDPSEMCQSKNSESVGPITDTEEIQVTLSSQAIEAEIHDKNLQLCKNLQESAITKGRYIGVEPNNNKVFYLKPKQFFDIGGANHERVLVPGTLLEVCHSTDDEFGIKLHHWFAIVVKNLGGRLTLRWFLCDDPKFKQGRLELKSCRSELVEEDEDQEENRDSNQIDKVASTTTDKLSGRGLIFHLHFCDPRIYTISHAKSLNRSYRLPEKIFSALTDMKGPEISQNLQDSQLDMVFDPRRINLDKDRPILDHLISTIRWLRPSYVNISFAPKDESSRRQVLFSTSKTTKLQKGFVKRELEPGVFEIQSESDNGTPIRFVYPYDGSYTILPTDWALNNQDCLSLQNSRSQSPLPDTQAQTSVNPNNLELTSKDSGECNQNSESLVINSNLTLMCEIVRPNLNDEDVKKTISEDFDELEPSDWYKKMRAQELDKNLFQCSVNTSYQKTVETNFKVMDHLKVVHPSSDSIICLGRIRKIVYPLLWIQISSDSYTLLPFNSTDIYPSNWCETNCQQLVSLIPPMKRLNNSSVHDKKRKRVKNDDVSESNSLIDGSQDVYERENLDLQALDDKQHDIDYVLNAKWMLIRIYFNHKCFTGPSLSKGKICSLPQYVGPGPLRLVMEEVVTKVISVAYVPPRILNDLSSKSFEELLIARNLTNYAPIEFKAKYQKRVLRENIPVCMNPDDVALYCECICEHLKCCYNLFGPNLYDGDDCPGHCRALTKSNKFMKRATYYREKARLGEFINDGGSSKKSNNSSKTSRVRYGGRGSSDSNSSDASRTDRNESRASSACDEVPMSDIKENLVTLREAENEEEPISESTCVSSQPNSTPAAETSSPVSITKQPEVEAGKVLHQNEHENNVSNIQLMAKVKPRARFSTDSEFEALDSKEIRPELWTVQDVADHLEVCCLGGFKPKMFSEGIDGPALLLLDRLAVREYFQLSPKSNFTIEELSKLCRFIDYLKTRGDTPTS